MLKIKRIAIILALLLAASPALAMQGTDHGGHAAMSDKTMDHSATGNGHNDTSGSYKHVDNSDGVQAAFQVMSLESMHMKNADGKTHHIMVSLSKNTQKMKKAVGEIEVVSPTGKKQIGKLMHFGGGMYAANFTFDEPGDWSVTCTFESQGTKYAKQFSYPHHK